MEKFKNIIEDILKIIGFENFKVNFKEEEAAFSSAEGVAEGVVKKILRVNLQIEEDASLLIGYKGGNLLDFQHVLRLVAEKNFKPCPILILDINNYRQYREEFVRQLAKRAARQAVLMKKPVELEPMNSAERRIVHSELASHPELTTQSRGEGAGRRVVIMPIQEK